MAKKVILKDNDNIEILPITRGELITDSSGNPAFHSKEFLATQSLPGLLSAEDKKKLDSTAGGNLDDVLSSTSTNPVLNKVITKAIEDVTLLANDAQTSADSASLLAQKALQTADGIKNKYLKSAVVNGNNLTITDLSNSEINFYNTTYDTFLKDTSNGSGGRKGLVPKPSYNSGSTNRYLREDGNWDTPLNDKVTLTNTTTSADYRVLFSENANDTTSTEGARKSSKLKFNPSTGTLTATTFNGNLDWTKITNKPSSFTPSTHYHPTSQINALTGYSKATEAFDLIVTDTLNIALGKLEYKADAAYTFYKSIFGPDTDDIINKYDEIVDFIDSVKEGSDITDEFVTRKTAQTITGAKTFSKTITSTVANGTAPFAITSTTKVTNLNVDMLDGYHESSFVKFTDRIDSSNTTTSVRHMGYGYSANGWKGSGPAISIGAVNGYIMQIQQLGEIVYVRHGEPNSFTDWKRLAYTANADTANVAVANKVANKLILTINSGTTEGTDLYTYDGSNAKTLNIKAGSNITLGTLAGVLTISSTNTNTTYTLSGALSGNTFVTTLTPSSGTHTTATVPAMTAATSSAAGKAGLVPAPGAGKNTSFLRGDGIWAIPLDTKVTSVDNHYIPEADSTKTLGATASSTTSATWGSTDLITGIKLLRDAKGHVTGITVDSTQLPSNPNVNTWRPVMVNGDEVASSTTGTGTLNLKSGAGITVSGTKVNDITITNAGVRSVTIGTGSDANKLAVNTNGTTTHLTIPYATLAAKVTCTASTDNIYRPIVLTNTSNNLYYSTKATINYSTGHIKAGALTSTGQITLYSSSGDSPHLYFLRGTTSDGTYDWDLYVTSGYMKFKYNNAGTYTEVLSLYPGNSTLDGYKILHAGNSSVSGNGGSTWGSSITVKINGVSKTLTIPANPNTWRPITDEYDVTSPSSTTSLSQTGAKSLLRNVRSFKRFLGTDTNGGYDLNTLTEGMVYNYSSTSYWKNGPSGMSYGRVLNLKDGSGGSIAGLLAWDINHNSTTDTTRYLWWRASDDGTFTEAKWHRLAYVDDIPSIPSVSITNTGSGNAVTSITASGHTLTVNKGSTFSLSNHNHDDRYVNVTGDTMTGSLVMSKGTAIYLWDDSATTSHRLTLRCASDIGRIYNYTGSAYGAMYVGHDGTNAIVITSGLNVGIGTGSPSQKLHVNGNAIATNLGVNSSGGGNGISLYNGSGNVATYGIAFNQTSNWSTHGYVTSDWATYFTMSNTNNRGWIFRRNGSGNVFSIDTSGLVYANGRINGNYYTSRVATGTLPYACTSTTLNTNLNADLLDGQHGSRYTRALGGPNYVTITVGGDAATYYPVVISAVSDKYPMLFVNISRGYSETAPSSWNTSTHKGGLTLTLLWNGSKYWDGNGSGSPCYVVYVYQSYCTMVGGFGNATTGKVVWLRGGGAVYHIHAMNGTSVTATVYTSTYTDSASLSFAPRTTVASYSVRWPGYALGADKLGSSTVGGTYQPIYLSSGTATAGTSYAKAIKAITRSGTTFTYTCIDGTTGTFTLQDNNTTYYVYGKTINASYKTAYRTLTGRASGYYLAAIRCDTASVAEAPLYGSGIAFGMADTHGYLYMNYSNAYAYIGAGNADKLNWTATLLHSSNSSVSGGGSAGGSSITVKINNTSKTLTIPTSLPANGGTSSYTNYLKIHDVRGTNHLPNSTTYPEKNITAWFNSTGTPDSNWWSGITVKGWTSTYAVWQLCSYSSTGTANNYRLYHRNGINGGWGSWKTIAYTSDIPTVTNYYWANVKVSSSSSTTTSPTFSTATATTLVTTPKIHSTGRLTLNATNTAIDLKFNNDNTKSVILNGSAFKPYDDSDNKLTLGSSSARWSNTYSVLGNFSGAITVYNSAGSWVSGMTSASIKYNGLSALSTGSYHPFLAIKGNAGHVVNFGGYVNNVGFYGYYSGRTANSYDWSFVVNTANGNWTSSKSIYAAHFYENSDILLKYNILEILNSEKIPIIKEFDWKEDGSHSYGLIAQELEEQGYYELVDVKDDGYKTVNYSAALSLIVGKLQVKIKELEKEIETLKNKN